MVGLETEGAETELRTAEGGEDVVEFEFTVGVEGIATEDEREGELGGEVEGEVEEDVEVEEIFTGAVALEVGTYEQEDVKKEE